LYPEREQNRGEKWLLQRLDFLNMLVSFKAVDCYHPTTSDWRINHCLFSVTIFSILLQLSPVPENSLLHPQTDDNSKTEV
jgi:hypothetical protein